MKWLFRTLVLAVASSCFLLGNPAFGQKQDGKTTVVPDELNQNDEKDKMFNQCACKKYTFKMTQGSTYLLELKSSFLPYMRLEDAGRTVATANRGGLAANLTYRATKTQDFHIIVTSINRGVGKFTLTIKELDAGNGKPLTLKFNKNEATYAGSLLATDPRYNNKIHKLFIVPLEAGKSYQIDHKSRNFDCYLYLEDPNGKVLAQDDDSGGGLDSRITHKATKTGNYRIVATSLGGTSTGEFTLSVRNTDPPAKK